MRRLLAVVLLALAAAQAAGRTVVPPGTWRIPPGTTMIYVGAAGNDNCSATPDRLTTDFLSTAGAILCLYQGAYFDSLDQPAARIVIALRPGYNDNHYAHIPLQAGFTGAVGRMAVILDGGGSNASCGCGWTGGIDLFFPGSIFAIQNGYIAELSLSEGAEVIFNTEVGVGITLGDPQPLGTPANVSIGRGSRILISGNAPTLENPYGGNVNASACGLKNMFALDGGWLEGLAGKVSLTPIGNLSCSDAVVRADSLSVVKWPFVLNNPSGHDVTGTAYKFLGGSQGADYQKIPGSTRGAIPPS